MHGYRWDQESLTIKSCAGASDRPLVAYKCSVIAYMLRAKKSVGAIGRALRRSAGTISREITRNSHPRLGYQPYGPPQGCRSPCQAQSQ